MKDYNLLKSTHKKLTFLCAGITILILIVMSLSYLYISEKSLRDNQFLFFKNSMNTFISNLNQQPVITHEWLITAEATGDFLIQIKDNGKDLLFNSRTNDASKEILFQYARSCFENLFTISSAAVVGTADHTEFSFTHEDIPYYGSIGTIYKENGTLEITLVSPATTLEQQIFRQRIIFLVIDLAAAFLLSVFAYYFTGKLLKPIAQNREDQIHFIAAASHELRTPLAVILSCASAAKKADSKEKSGFLDTIHFEGMRMSRLIGDMLLLSKTDNHTFYIDKTECDPDTILLNSFESFETLAKEKGITLSVSLPGEPAKSCFLDHERIQQVLSILIHNALSYTSYNGHVSLSMEVRDDHISYSVADNGIGIPEEEKKHIFKRFYRVDHSRNEKEHFGLGLSIAYEITQAHKGSILVSDTPGGGSTFTVKLPLNWSQL